MIYDRNGRIDYYNLKEIHMIKVLNLLIATVVCVSAQSQVLYLDNWKNIDGIKKISVTHYSAVESLGEIDADKQLLKIVGLFNQSGLIIEEKVFYSEYDKPVIYQIFYDEVTGKVKELLHEYDELGNGEKDFGKKVRFKFNQQGDVEIAETWCNMNKYDCAKLVIDNNNYYVLQSSMTDYNEENWLLTSRYKYSYDENGNLLGGEYEAKCCTNISAHDFPEQFFNIYDKMVRKLLEFRGYDLNNQLLNYSMLPDEYDKSKIDQVDVQVLKAIDPQRRLPEPFQYYTFDRSYEYNFNDKGDWVKCIVFDGERPVRIILREIKY